MGRGQGIIEATAGAREPLPDGQEKIMALLKEQGASGVKGLRDSGLKPAEIRKALEDMEEWGLVTRCYNGNGPNEPWYWERAWRRPTNFEEPKLTKGQIWDWSEKVWVEVKKGRNAHGHPRVMIKAGENNQFDTVLPLHYFGKILYLRRQPDAGDFTDWSRGFICPIHGVATVSMVRTDKLCSRCKTPLLRV